MSYQQLALGIGSIFIGILCVLGGIGQVFKGETWGATGKSRVRRDDEPLYFWFLFVVRILLGPILAVLGLLSLR